MEIKGLRIEKYIGVEVDKLHLNFIRRPAEKVKHILFGILSTGTKVKITLYTEEGECNADWSPAQWSHLEVEEVENFPIFTHFPKRKLIIPDLEPDFYHVDDISNDVFTYSYNGGDSHFPQGRYEVFMDKFRRTVRQKGKRLVWIFQGPSDSGKSFLGNKITNLGVYETDSSSELPKEITADVIILGDKYDFTLEDIEERIFGKHKTVTVQFS